MINGAKLCRKAIPGSDRLRSSGFALPLHGSVAKFESMDDKPDNVPVQPDLVASIRQARVENAERADAIAEVRDLEIARLKALESALESVVDQAPQGADLFDMALTQSEHPRLFLDMIALRRLGDALSWLLMLLGSITLAVLLWLGAYWAWTSRLRDLWTQWIGAPPF
jgi:hypothetical protein